ncbi:MAG: hypothetical protein KUG53_04280 [Pseudomonadales bacterium]|nr:hypothetical protein [Pseudomonadales bacterium]
MKQIIILAVSVAAIFWAVSYFSGGKNGLITDNVTDEVTITEVQKWQDAQGVWHFSNGDVAPEQSETVTFRSDRNIIKADGVEQPHKQQNKQLNTGVETDGQPTQLSRITTIQQGINALQQAGQVQDILDQRAEQQEKQLESYR